VFRAPAPADAKKHRKTKGNLRSDEQPGARFGALCAGGEKNIFFAGENLGPFERLSAADFRLLASGFRKGWKGGKAVFREKQKSRRLASGVRRPGKTKA
jgi:hypothetical protein